MSGPSSTELCCARRLARPFSSNANGTSTTTLATGDLLRPNVRLWATAFLVPRAAAVNAERPPQSLRLIRVHHYGRVIADTGLLSEISEGLGRIQAGAHVNAGRARIPSV